MTVELECRNARAVAGCNLFVLSRAKVKRADANIRRLNALRTVKDRDRFKIARRDIAALKAEDLRHHTVQAGMWATIPFARSSL